MGIQIFISYRRDGGEYLAQLFYDRLTQDGYDVFLDVETLRSGEFNTAIYEKIDECTDFLLILPPRALERCSDQNDWVRLEIERAIEKNKNIIPVMMRGFEFPRSLPPSLAGLPMRQGIAANMSLFDGTMQKLKTTLLRSDPIQYQFVNDQKYVEGLRKLDIILYHIANEGADDYLQDYVNTLYYVCEKTSGGRHNDYLRDKYEEVHSEISYLQGLESSAVSYSRLAALTNEIWQHVKELLSKVHEPDEMLYDPEYLETAKLIDRLLNQIYEQGSASVGTIQKWVNAVNHLCYGTIEGRRHTKRNDQMREIYEKAKSIIIDAQRKSGAFNSEQSAAMASLFNKMWTTIRDILETD